jgi:hypothetical protein
MVAPATVKGAPGLATRVMKARRESACPACCGPVRVGQQIAKTGTIWVHATCLIARRQAGAAGGNR